MLTWQGYTVGSKIHLHIILLMLIFFSLLQNDINDYRSKGRVILCGDWNAHVGHGTRPDYVVRDTSVDS